MGIMGYKGSKSVHSWPAQFQDALLENHHRVVESRMIGEQLTTCRISIQHHPERHVTLHQAISQKAVQLVNTASFGASWAMPATVP
jgi:hypothetical protein